MALSEIDALDEAATAALNDPRALMPAIMLESRRLMHDRDAEVRSRAVGIGWFAIRQMLPFLEPAERVALCDAISADLEVALAAELVPPWAMLGGIFRRLIQRIRDGGGVLAELSEP